MESPTVKTRCDVYNFKFQPYGWAILFVDDRGLLSIQSDWGDFSYYWSHPGMSFKKFLAKQKPPYHYLAEKLGLGNGQEKHFFEDRSVKELKKTVVQARRDGTLDREEARDLWEDIHEIDDCCSHSAAYFVHLVLQSDQLMSLYDNDPTRIPVEQGVHPRVYRMLDVVWPELTKALEAEGLT